MTRPAIGKRTSKQVAEVALVRRLAGALPLSSSEGVARVAAWLADIKAGVAGKASLRRS